MVQVACCFLATLVDLSTPLPFRWKLSFEDLSETAIVTLPAGSRVTTFPSSLSVRNPLWPTVASRNVPSSTNLGANVVMFGSVLMMSYFFASRASSRSFERSSNGLQLGRRMLRIAAGRSARISSGWLFAYVSDWLIAARNFLTRSGFFAIQSERAQ